MAKQKLIVCKHCGNSISKKAKKCPQCGGKNQNTKKLWVIVAILVAVCFILPALTEGSDTSESKTTTNGNNSISSEGPLFSKGDTSSLPKIESSVIYEGNNVKMTATEITQKGNSFIINILIENNSSLNLGFNAHSYAINGIMTRNNIFAMDCDVAAGKKANASLELESSVLREYGISEIRCVDVLFWAYDNDKSFKEFETGQIEIKTDLYNGKHDKIEGKNIYDSEGIGVDYLSCDGDKYKFCITNNTGEYLAFDFNEITINDFTNSKIDLSLYSEELLDSCQIVVEINVDNEFKATNKIEKAETIEWNMEIRPNDDYFNSRKIGPIVYSVQ